MKSLSHLSIVERKLRLRGIIQTKVKAISYDNLDCIMDRLNANRPYVIKSMSCPRKFQNIITEEYVGMDTRKSLSKTFPIFGTFSAGQFIQSDHQKYIYPGTMSESEPAAAVKVSIDNTEGFLSKTYTLAIYTPK